MGNQEGCQLQLRSERTSLQDAVRLDLLNSELLCLNDSISFPVSRHFAVALLLAFIAFTVAQHGPCTPLYGVLLGGKGRRTRGTPWRGWRTRLLWPAGQPVFATDDMPVLRAPMDRCVMALRLATWPAG